MFNMCSLSLTGVPPSAMSNPFFLPQIHISLNSYVSAPPPPQSRSPRHSQSTQSGLADQAAKLSFASAESLETMSEADIPLGFNRMNRFRQSLPLSRSASQNKLRSPGKDLKRHLQAGRPCHSRLVEKGFFFFFSVICAAGDLNHCLNSYSTYF